MKLRTLALCTLSLILSVPAIAADKSPMKPGNWETSVQMEMAGMKMPPVTVTNCVSKEQAEHPEAQNSSNDEGCTVSDYKIAGNTVSWSIECKKHNMTGTGQITFDGDTYSGVSHMKMGEQDMTQKLTGKYLGACDK